VTRVFLDPPRDAIAEYPLVPLFLTIPLVVVSVVTGVVCTRRTGSPLYFWAAIAHLPPDYVAAHITLAYASTVHTAQGRSPHAPLMPSTWFCDQDSASIARV
jgi:hypothetical protein